MPSKRRTLFSSRLLIAGAVPPALPDLAATLRQSCQTENSYNDEKDDRSILAGLHHLENAGIHLDISLFEELDQLNVWILACLSRTIPAIRENMTRQLMDLGLDGTNKFPWLNAEHQVIDMIHAAPPTRMECLTTLAIGGTGAMIRPLLSGGVDVENRAEDYLKSAIDHFNFDAALAFLEHTKKADIDLLQFVCSHIVKVNCEPDSGGEWISDWGTFDTNAFRIISWRGPMVVQFFERLMENIDLHTLDPDHPALKLVVALVVGLILPGPVHDIRFFHMQSIKESRHYTDWPKATGVRIIEILLKSGILRDGRLVPSVEENSFREKYFGWVWYSSPILSALRYLNDNQFEIIKLFVKYGYDLDEENEEGLTAVMYAAYGYNFEIVQYLVENGASLVRPNSRGIVFWKFAIRVLCCLEELDVSKDGVSEAENRRSKTEFEEEIRRWQKVILNFVKLQGGLEFEVKLQKAKQYIDGRCSKTDLSAKSNDIEPLLRITIYRTVGMLVDISMSASLKNCSVLYIGSCGDVDCSLPPANVLAIGVFFAACQGNTGVFQKGGLHCHGQDTSKSAATLNSMILITSPPRSNIRR
jgi:hypothetical protein